VEAEAVIVVIASIICSRGVMGRGVEERGDGGEDGGIWRRE
jgi:hypothetical protein